MKAMNVIAIAMLAAAMQLPPQVMAAKPVKPPPPPVTAEDVVCEGCVGTSDIADGSVTTQKISNDLLGIITQLNDRIDALESRPSLPIAIDANGNSVGQILDYTIGHGYSGTVQDHRMTLYTDKGYIVGLNHFYGLQTYRYVVFTGNNCTGDSYTQIVEGIGPGRVIQAGHKPDRAPDPNKPLYAYYIPTDAEPTNGVYITSSLSQGVCANLSPTTYNSIYQVLPNDPAITGMESDLFAVPIRPAR